MFLLLGLLLLGLRCSSDSCSGLCTSSSYDKQVKSKRQPKREEERRTRRKPQDEGRATRRGRPCHATRRIRARKARTRSNHKQTNKTRPHKRLEAIWTQCVVVSQVHKDKDRDIRPAPSPQQQTPSHENDPSISPAHHNQRKSIHPGQAHRHTQTRPLLQQANRESLKSDLRLVYPSLAALSTDPCPFLCPWPCPCQYRPCQGHRALGCRIACQGCRPCSGCPWSSCAAAAAASRAERFLLRLPRAWWAAGCLCLALCHGPGPCSGVFWRQGSCCDCCPWRSCSVSG